MEEELQIA